MGVRGRLRLLIPIGVETHGNAVSPHRGAMYDLSSSVCITIWRADKPATVSPPSPVSSTFKVNEHGFNRY